MKNNALDTFTRTEYAGRMKTASEVIDALGGTTATAKIFGVLPSAVSNWRAAGMFPAALHYRVFRVCQARNIDLPDDFFPSSDAA